MRSEQKFDQSMIGSKDTLISQVFPFNTKIILTESELHATSERFVWAILKS